MNIIKIVKDLVKEVKVIRKRIMDAEDKMDLRNYELSEGLKKIPKNCFYSTCPCPAKNRDRDGKHLCVAHSDRGRWKK